MKGKAVLVCRRRWLSCARVPNTTSMCGSPEPATGGPAVAGVLETLAIIAYRQPDYQSRGGSDTRVRADRACNPCRSGFDKEVGRMPGRPVMYGTTEEFRSCLIDQLQDLPAVLEEIMMTRSGRGDYDAAEVRGTAKYMASVKTWWKRKYARPWKRGL